MKSRLIALALSCGALLFTAGLAQAEKVTTPINLISETGVGEQIGSITFSDGPKGLMLEVDVKKLPAGVHGFHIHEVGDCGPALNPDGKPTAGLAAKGHYDPDKTGAHKGPGGGGHKGDLPPLTVDANGAAKVSLAAEQLKVADLHKRAVIIHAGGDNFADLPVTLGGGGARIACGVIP